jgi:hypothetical protein
MKRQLACAIVAVTILFGPDIRLHSQEVLESRSRINKGRAQAFVRSFYQLVVAHHPVAIPDSAEMKVFTPYLSRALQNRIDLARACSADWDRQHPAPPILKPPFGWLESGLFSGGDEKTSPRLYHVESTQLEKDGSFRVQVRLTWGLAERPWTWHVVALVAREDDRFAIDDVIYLKEEPEDTDWRLSDALAEGCDGPRWIGDRDKR